MLHKRWASLLMAFLMLCVAVAPTGAFAEDASAVPVEATEAPVIEVTEAPTEIPTEAPTEAPTEVPTEAPTEAPTEVPTEAPTEVPTEVPTEAPTEAPTAAPTEVPTEAPTEVPTEVPTDVPTEAPTEAPDVFVPGYARLCGGTKLYDTPALQGEASKLDGNAVVYAAKRTDDKTAVKVAVFDGASVIEKWVKAERVAMMSAAEAQQHEAACGDDCASYAGCLLPAAVVVVPQPAVTEAPIVTEAPATEAPAAGIADMIATVATNPPVVAPSLPSGEQVATIESRSPLKVVALHAASQTANVGDTLTFTTQFEGSGDIAWIEYHIYNTVGQHLTGYRGEGAGISGVYHYDTAVTGAGKYCARVYLMAKDGTFTHVDSIWVTVGKVDPLHVTALTAASPTAVEGDKLTFTTQFAGKGDIAWIEYHVYNIYGQHLTGYHGEGAGISGVYHYDTSVTGPGRYCGRVYLMATDGNFTHVDSEWIEVTQAAEPLTVTALTPDKTTVAPGETVTFTAEMAGEGELAWIEYHIYDQNSTEFYGWRGEGDEATATYQFTLTQEISGITFFFARAYVMASDGTFSQVDSEWVSVSDIWNEENFTYTIENGEATVTGYVGKVRDQGLNIPATLGGCPVRKIGDRAFHGRSDLSGPLTIPNGVASIGDYAFAFCSSFTGSLILPDGLTSIGEWAFSDCKGLTGSLTLPDGLTYIGDRAFGCSGFTGSLTFPDGLISIGDHAFYDCSGFTGSLSFPDGLTSIGVWAFRDCTGFTGSLTLPDGLTSIGVCAFEYCSGFTGSLTLPDGLTSIGEGAFSHCTGFTGSLTLPDGLTSTGNYAFYDCSGFTGSLSFPDGLTSIGEFAFMNCTGFTGNLTFPESLTSIGTQAFYNCSGFTGSLTFSKGLTYIGDYAFMICSGLSGSLTFPASLAEIGWGAFSDCPNLTTVHAPAGSYAAQWAVDNGYTLVAQ